MDVLLAQLSGVGPERPMRKQEYFTYAKLYYERDIKDEFERRWDAEKEQNGLGMVNFWNAVGREIFERQPRYHLS